MKKAAFFLVMILFGASGFTQDKKVEWSFETMVYSQYAWRGDQLSDVPMIAPSVEFSTGGFSLGLWAAKAFDKNYSEIDITPSYSVGNFTFELCDYYFPVTDAENNYFNFKKNESRHSVEFSVKYEASEKFPVRWSVGSFIAGDKNPFTENPYFSTYIEAGYPFTAYTIDIEPVIGLTPSESFYAPNFAVINLGVSAEKVFSIGENWSIPIQLYSSYNPNADKFFLNLAVGIRFN